jgi:hypothetical protein
MSGSSINIRHTTSLQSSQFARNQRQKTVRIREMLYFEMKHQLKGYG